MADYVSIRFQSSLMISQTLKSKLSNITESCRKLMENIRLLSAFKEMKEREEREKRHAKKEKKEEKEEEKPKSKNTDQYDLIQQQMKALQKQLDNIKPSNTTETVPPK